jgi:pimeloyl-ACP methyl ester carboxylesterase
MLSSFAGGRVFGASYGDGPPRVVALHGWARTHTDFDKVLDGYDAIALDLPGYGATPEPPGDWGSPEYAALVADVLRALPAPPVLVGHSLGGRIGVHVAATYPELVEGLLLTGAPLIRVGEAAKPKAGYRVVRWLNRRGVISDARMNAAREKNYAEDWRNASAGMRPVFVNLVNENYDAQIDALRAPIELVWGSDDTAAPIAGAELLDARLGGKARLTVLPDTGHLTPLVAADELRAALDRLLTP